jgi:hypothetical protein
MAGPFDTSNLACVNNARPTCSASRTSSRADHGPTLQGAGVLASRGRCPRRRERLPISISTACPPEGRSGSCRTNTLPVSLSCARATSDPHWDCGKSLSGPNRHARLLRFNAARPAATARSSRTRNLGTHMRLGPVRQHWTRCSPPPAWWFHNADMTPLAQNSWFWLCPTRLDPCVKG